MKNILAGLSLLFVLCPIRAATPLPRDVSQFIERREGCDHMRGEAPVSGRARRVKDFNREVEKLCRGTDQELLRLKKKHAASPSITKLLNEFEPNIEATRSKSADRERF